MNLFTIETLFGTAGVYCLTSLGLVCVLFALLLPRGIWGELERRFGVQLLPVGYRLGGLPTPVPEERYPEAR